MNQLYNHYFDLYKKYDHSTDVRNEEKGGRDYKLKEIIDNRGQELKSTKQEGTRQKKLMKYKNHYRLN